MLWVVYAVVVLALLSMAYAGYSAAPYIPSWKHDRIRITKRVASHNPKVVYELGSGDGSLVLDIARQLPDTTVIGLEISVPMYLVSKMRIAFSGQKNAQIRFKNLYKQPLNDADIVFFFLTKKVYSKLQGKFAKELKDSCVVLAEVWPFPGMEPDFKDIADNRLTIYQYKGSQFKEV